MTGLPYFENLSQVIEMFDDELMLECLRRLEHELVRRGKFQAASELTAARLAYGPPAPAAVPRPLSY